MQRRLADQKVKWMNENSVQSTASNHSNPIHEQEEKRKQGINMMSELRKIQEEMKVQKESEVKDETLLDLLLELYQQRLSELREFIRSSKTSHRPPS